MNSPITITTTASSTEYQIVSRARIGSVTSGIPIQQVACPADRADQPARAELLAQLLDVHIHDVGAALVVRIPDVLEDACARAHLAGMSHQEFQQRELLGGELDRIAGVLDGMRSGVESERTD